MRWSEQLMSSDSIQTWSPRSVSEALDRLAEDDDVTIIAGGTDVMVYVQAQALRPRRVLNIWGLDALRGISETDEHVLIGALDCYTDIIGSAIVQRELPTLVESARTIGAIQIQNRGTLGGNFANASPAADTPPVLLACGGALELRSARGSRWVDFDRFFLGYKQVDRRSDELITRFRIQKASREDKDWYLKVGTRQAQAISKVVMGGRARMRADGTIASARLAVGSVAAVTLRLPTTEALLAGRVPDAQLEAEAMACAAAEVTPIDDIRSTEDYRRRVSGNLAARFVRVLRG